jgi:hypothetical protein
MPRWASRITLEIVSVRVERLQEITEEDAAKEGIPTCIREDMECLLCNKPKPCLSREGFVGLWDSPNGKTHPWASNPFVWVIEFRREEA